MSKLMNPSNSDSDAKFLGWQKKFSEDVFPLFNITVADHPLYQSTVSEATLRKLHLRVPRIPSPYSETIPALWHNLGTELNHPATAKEAIQMAGLDYTVVKKSLGLKTGLKQEAYATLRTDTGDILGVANESYEPIQNIDAFTFFDTLVAEDKAIYETAGILGKGECVWILAKLPGYIKVHGNDIVNKYILLTNHHDSSAHVRLKIIPIRVICNNSLTAALQGAEILASVIRQTQPGIHNRLPKCSPCQTTYTKNSILYSTVWRQRRSMTSSYGSTCRRWSRFIKKRATRQEQKKFTPACLSCMARVVAQTWRVEPCGELSTV